MTTDHIPLTEAKPPVKRRAGKLGAAAIGALVAVFAVLNSQSVEVNWIVGSTRTPLIVVIVLFLAAGLACGLILSSRPPGTRRRKR